MPDRISGPATPGLSDYLVCLVYLVDEVPLVYLVCPVGLARAIS
jgi:hypothetical protein